MGTRSCAAAPARVERVRPMVVAPVNSHYFGWS